MANNLDHATIMYERQGYCNTPGCKCRQEDRPHIVTMQAIPNEPAQYSLDDGLDHFQTTPFNMEFIGGWQPA